MTTNLACVGMAVSTTEALDALVSEITRLGEEKIDASLGVETFAWQDDSGARVAYDVLAGTPHILPTFASTSEVTYRSLEQVSPEVAKVTVLGADGQGETGVTCQLEQRRHLSGAPQRGQIRLTALGTQVTTYPDETTFLASDASLLGTEDELGPPPAEVEERGLAWPPRMSASAFLANGFYGPVKPTPYALMSGLVTHTEARTNSLTGGRFRLAQVRTAFGALDVCLAGDTYDDLHEGSVIAGTVAMTGRLVSAEEADRPRAGETRRDWRRRTGRE